MGRSDDDFTALHDEVRGRLRAEDQLYTSGRQRLVELLASAGHPVTIPELVESHAGVALSSAYRNMAVLEQVGIVSRIVSGPDHARFELTEEVMGHHHHHLICQSCGGVEDFTVPAAIEKTLDKALDKVAASSSFVVSAHRLDLVGTCSDCSTA